MIDRSWFVENAVTPNAGIGVGGSGLWLGWSTEPGLVTHSVFLRNEAEEVLKTDPCLLYTSDAADE